MTENEWRFNKAFNHYLKLRCIFPRTQNLRLRKKKEEKKDKRDRQHKNKLAYDDQKKFY